MKRIALSIVLLTVSSGVAWGVWRFDRPNFYSDYQLPPTQTPQPRAPWAEYVDLALLIAALSVASWLALKKRSRRWCTAGPWGRRSRSRFRSSCTAGRRART